MLSPTGRNSRAKGIGNIRQYPMTVSRRAFSVGLGSVGLLAACGNGIGSNASATIDARVKAVTGYAIGGVSPVGLPDGVPVFMDESLFRFATVWSAAGHPHCVFQASPHALQALCGATLADGIGIIG